MVLCGESGEKLKIMVGRFVKVCMRSGLKVIADKSNVLMLGGEKGLGCKIRVEVVRFEQVSEFK